MPQKKGRLTSRKNKQSKTHIARAQATRNKRQHQTCSVAQWSGLGESVETATIQAGNIPKEEPDSNDSPFHGFDVPPLKPTLRLLSLFDGIGTAFFILEKLGFFIEKYLSSEVDEKAISLLKYKYSEVIDMLGSVEDITPSNLEQHKINFLIGGSPCSELSLVNPRRKGLEVGSGKLFFHYVRIRNHLQKKAMEDGFNFYWLFENTANMECKTKASISEHLGCQPVVMNASHFLPVERKRFFWTNIPNKLPSESKVYKLEMEDILASYRKAKVRKVPTLTTSSHSQKSGSLKQLPVEEDGKSVPLFITDIEALFGLPRSYTDGPNLTITDRRRLLGKAFCVPVLEKLLEPLTELFWLKPIPSPSISVTDSGKQVVPIVQAREGQC